MTAADLQRHAPWLLALLAAAAWAASLANGFVWDDRILIVENAALVGPDAISGAFGDFWAVSDGASGYWRPLVTLSYVAEVAAWGVRPLPFHATNIALHAAVVGLLARWLLRIGAAPALIGVMWFAVHPALAESVAWISGRTDTMAMLFLLLALQADRRALAIGALALALLSKEIAVAVPLVAIASDVAGGRELRAAIRDRLDWIGVVAVYAAVRIALVGLPAGAGSDLDVAARIAAAPHVLGLLVVPWVGRAEYGAGLPAELLVPGAVAGISLVAGLATTARTDRRVAALLAGGLLLYAPSLAVMLGRGIVGERLAYGPGALLLPALALALAQAPRWAGVAVGATLLATTLAKQADYRSDLTLFERAAAAPHPSPRVHLNYGIALHDRGHLSEAREHLRIAARSPIDQAPYMLGLLYDELGCQDLAEADYRRALEISPGYGAAAGNLAGLLAGQGRGREAQAVIEASLAAREDARLRANLGAVGSVRGSKVADPPECATDAGISWLMTNPEHLSARATRMGRQGRADSERALRAAAALAR